MTPDRLSALLGASAGNVGPRTDSCPDESTVAGYVDGGLPAAEAERFELHLADCGTCLALVGFLSRERRTAEFEPVPAATLARAGQGEPARRALEARYASYLATAAALFLAVALLLNVTQLAGSRGDAMDGKDFRAERGGASGAAQPQLIFPQVGATVPGKRLAFRWTAVAGSQYYEVRILSDVGDVLADERVSGTHWQPHATLGLRAGTDYYVHVDAHLADDRSVASEHVRFRVVP